VGDPLYGARRRLVHAATPAMNAALQGFRRQALHAQRLHFLHPLSGQPQCFEAPVPADLQSLLQHLRADARRPATRSRSSR
jgi:23S rRNA pseudouridine1911/1915/1917 synthase